MKSLILAVFLLTQIASAQTKDESIDWLNQKLDEYTDRFMGNFEISSTTFNGKEALKISVQMNMSSRYYVFDPKTITSVITTTEYRTDGKLGLKLISNTSQIYEDGKTPVKEIEIYCKPGPDETIVRMQKGIIHLLNLMGNAIKINKELFTN